MQPRPFEEWIEKGHQQDANLCSEKRRNVVYWNPNGRSSMISCSTYACPTDERSLVRGGDGYNQGFLYTLPRRKGMWRGSALSHVWGSPSCARGDSQFIAKIEMAMRCRGVGGEEVGVKYGCMQGCCECARPGMRSWWRMMQVAASTKTSRVGAAAHQS